MKQATRAGAVFVTLLVVLLGYFTVAFADSDTGGAVGVAPQAVAQGYLPVTAAGAYRTAVSSGDNADLESVSVATVTTLSCGGKTTISVGGTLSVSAATSLIEVVRYRNGELRGYSQATLTAVTSAPTTGGRYPCQTLYFDTGNCDTFKVLLRGNPSSGNVTLKVDTY